MFPLTLKLKLQINTSCTLLMQMYLILIYLAIILMRKKSYKKCYYSIRLVYLLNLFKLSFTSQRLPDVAV